LAASNSFATTDAIIQAKVAIARVETVQARIGDVVAQGCALLSALLTVLSGGIAAVTGMRRRRPEGDAAEG
jgi:hypothetical protein